MRTALLLPIGVGVLLLASCGGDADSSSAEAETSTAEFPPAPTADQLARARVRLESLDGLEVDLVDGVGQGQMGEQITLLAAYHGVGDFDGDGVPETAVLVASEPGGSGVFTHLVAFRGGPDGPEQVAEMLLGDRQQFHHFEAVADSLVMELTTHAPGDAMCCPTRRARQVYRIRDGAWRIWRDNTLTDAPSGDDGAVQRDSARPPEGGARSVSR